MSRTSQTECSPSAPTSRAGADRSSVALVARGGSQERNEAILEDQGLDFDLLEMVEDLLQESAIPSLIVPWVVGALSAGVVRYLKPLRRAMGRTPVVMVCADMR